MDDGDKRCWCLLRSPVGIIICSKNVVQYNGNDVDVTVCVCVCAKGLLTKVVSTSTHPKIYSRFSSSLSILKESWGIIIGPGITLVYCDILSCIKLAWKRFCSFQPSIYWTVVLLNSQSVWSHTNRKYTKRKILCVNLRTYVRTYNFVAKSNGNNLNNMSHTRFMRIYQDH